MKRGADPYSIIDTDLRENDGLLSGRGLEAFDEYDDAVLLESVLPDREGGISMVFVEAVEVIRAHRPAEVVPAMVRAQMYLEQGCHIAGYVAYEAAPAFLPVPAREPVDGPTFLVWFGVYDRPIIAPRAGRRIPESTIDPPVTVGQLSPDVNRNEYGRALKTIRRYLEEGRTYQVNYTFPVVGHFDSSAVDLYARLRQAQPVAYASYVRHGDTAVVSLSPELFFRTDGLAIIMKPMKGTAPRGMTTAGDREMRAKLAGSEKDRAENLMIVDLLRNDLGKLAATGSVAVPSFFDVEKYRTVLQATSTVKASLRRPVALVDLFKALFPCGSVTGAPKIETMKIIDELEAAPRGVYTGAIGYASPTGAAAFSVAIRTLQADEEEGVFRVHVGSGVTVGSEPGGEYDECLLKARFVEYEPASFGLVETILWRPGRGFWLLREHLRRLQDSAEYFDREIDRAAIVAELEKVNGRLKGETRPQRIRLVAAADGAIAVDAKPLEPLPDRLKVGFSKRRVSSSDVYQYHKTTHRPVYDEVLESARRRGWFDAIVLNERGEVVEGSRSNVLIRVGDRWRTPAITTGALPGVYRSTLLRSSARRVEEAVLTPDDIHSADEVHLCNALRGSLRVEVVGVRR